METHYLSVLNYRACFGYSLAFLLLPLVCYISEWYILYTNNNTDIPRMFMRDLLTCCPKIITILVWILSLPLQIVFWPFYNMFMTFIARGRYYSADGSENKNKMYKIMDTTKFLSIRALMFEICIETGWQLGWHFNNVMARWPPCKYGQLSVKENGNLSFY